MKKYLILFMIFFLPHIAKSQTVAPYTTSEAILIKKIDTVVYYQNGMVNYKTKMYEDIFVLTSFHENGSLSNQSIFYKRKNYYFDYDCDGNLMRFGSTRRNRDLWPLILFSSDNEIAIIRLQKRTNSEIFIKTPLNLSAECQ